jgi:hypothetical protein
VAAGQARDNEYCGRDLSGVYPSGVDVYGIVFQSDKLSGGSWVHGLWEWHGEEETEWIWDGVQFKSGIS